MSERRRRRPGPGPDRGPRPLGESLDRAVARLLGPRGARGGPGRAGAGPNGADGSDGSDGSAGASPSALFTRWAEIAGPDLAAFTTPVRLADGVLAVAVDHPARATVARAGAAALLGRARQVTGVPIDRLTVTVRRP